MTTILINVFRDGSEWFGARWVDGKYDGCDSLDIADESDAAEAMAAAREMPMTCAGERQIKRVDDINSAVAGL